MQTAAALHPDIAHTEAPKPRRRAGVNWTKSQVAQFAYMCGLGFTGPQIGNVLDCSTASVAGACNRFGVQLARRRNGDVIVPAVIAKETAKVFDFEAVMRGITRKELVERLLAALGEDDGGVLIANVLDDGGE